MARLSVGRILRRDWAAFSLILFVGIWWLFVVAVYVLAALSKQGNAEEDPTFLLVFAVGTFVITAACGALAVWRIRMIRKVFTNGVVLQGEVAHVGANDEDVGHAIVVYRYGGREFQVRNVTQSAPGRGRFQVGESVEVIVDPEKPSRAFLVRLYD
jgi:hypothetical protein